MLTLTLTALLVTLAVLAARPTAANAYQLRHKPAGWVDNHLRAFRVHTNRVRAAKCLSRLRWTVAGDELPAKGTVRRRNIRVAAKRYHLRADLASSRCAPWPGWWYVQAMCVHRREASWHNPTGIGPSVSGGMQIGDYEWGVAGGHRYAPRAYLATPFQQLIVAYRYYRMTGSDWSPWPTFRAYCA